MKGQHAVDAFPLKIHRLNNVIDFASGRSFSESVLAKRQTSSLRAVRSASDERADEVFMAIVGSDVEGRVAVLVDAVDLAAWETEITFRNVIKTNLLGHSISTGRITPMMHNAAINIRASLLCEVLTLHCLGLT